MHFSRRSGGTSWKKCSKWSATTLKRSRSSHRCASGASLQTSLANELLDLLARFTSHSIAARICSATAPSSCSARRRYSSSARTSRLCSRVLTSSTRRTRECSSSFASRCSRHRHTRPPPPPTPPPLPLPLRARRSRQQEEEHQQLLQAPRPRAPTLARTALWARVTAARARAMARPPTRSSIAPLSATSSTPMYAVLSSLEFFYACAVHTIIAFRLQLQSAW